MRSAPFVLAAALLAGCLAAVPADPEATVTLESAPAVDLAYGFEGVLTGAPAQPGVREFGFEVPPNATEIRARLAWTGEDAALDVLLFDPEGRETERGFAETPTTRAFATVHPPAPGNWTLQVQATRAVQKPFEVLVEVTHARPEAQRIDATYTVGTRAPVREVARLQSGGFAEINLVLEKGASFTYAWTASQPVYFNIHYHADGHTERAVEATEASLAGNFTAPFDQVFSLLWRNENPTPATIEVAVEGVWREHSRTR